MYRLVAFVPTEHTDSDPNTCKYAYVYKIFIFEEVL